MLTSTPATNRFEIYNPVIRDGVIAVTPDQMNVFSLSTVLGQQVAGSNDSLHKVSQYFYPWPFNTHTGGVPGPGRPGQDSERRAWSDLPAGLSQETCRAKSDNPGDPCEGWRQLLGHLPQLVKPARGERGGPPS